MPNFLELEGPVGVILAVGRVAQPHLPIDVVVAFAIRARIGVDVPIPFAVSRVPMIRALAQYHLTDHTVLDGLFGLPPLIRAGRLGAYLEHPARLLYSFIYL